MPSGQLEVQDSGSVSSTETFRLEVLLGSDALVVVIDNVISDLHQPRPKHPSRSKSTGLVSSW